MRTYIAEGINSALNMKQSNRFAHPAVKGLLCAWRQLRERADSNPSRHPRPPGENLRLLLQSVRPMPPRRNRTGAVPLLWGRFAIRTVFVILQAGGRAFPVGCGNQNCSGRLLVVMYVDLSWRLLPGAKGSCLGNSSRFMWRALSCALQ